MLIKQRIEGVNGGWVGLDQVCQLSEFRRHPRNSVGRIILNAGYRTYGLLRILIEKFSEFHTNGPFALLISPANIAVEFANLNLYLEWCSFPTDFYSGASGSELWNSALNAYHCNEYYLCQTILKNLIVAGERNKNIPRHLTALGWTLFAHLNLLAGGREEDSRVMLQNAKRIAIGINNIQLNCMLRAYAMNVQFNGFRFPELDFGHLNRLIRSTIQLLERVKAKIRDKYSLMGSHFYLDYYHKLRLYPAEADKKLLDRALELYSQMEDLPSQRIVEPLKGVARTLQKQADLILRTSAGSPFEVDECRQIAERIDKGLLDMSFGLMLIEWVCYNCKVTGREEDLAAIAQETLIKFPNAHELRSFKSIKGIYLQQLQK